MSSNKAGNAGGDSSNPGSSSGSSSKLKKEDLIAALCSTLAYKTPYEPTIFSTIFYKIAAFFKLEVQPPRKDFEDIIDALANEIQVSNANIIFKPFYKTNMFSWLIDPRPAGYVIKIADKCVVAYHGTMPTSSRGIVDVIDDLNFIPIGTNGIHTGFLGAYKASAASMQNTLKTMNSSNESILFAGHSLGGALAQIAAYDIATKNELSTLRDLPTVQSIQVSTIGAPAIFSESQAKNYNESVPNTNSIYIEGDVIPSIGKTFSFPVGKRIRPGVSGDNALESHSATLYIEGIKKALAENAETQSSDTPTARKREFASLSARRTRSLTV